MIHVTLDITIKKSNESDGPKENHNQKKLVDDKWRDNVNQLGLDHNMKYYRILITNSDYEDSRFLEALKAMHNIHPHIKFNTFDVVRYTKPTDEQLEQNEFTFRLMTRQYNGPYDLNLLNEVLETRVQEKRNQSIWLEYAKIFQKNYVYTQVLYCWRLYY